MSLRELHLEPPELCFSRIDIRRHHFQGGGALWGEQWHKFRIKITTFCLCSVCERGILREEKLHTCVSQVSYIISHKHACVYKNPKLIFSVVVKIWPRLSRSEKRKEKTRRAEWPLDHIPHTLKRLHLPCVYVYRYIYSYRQRLHHRGSQRTLLSDVIDWPKSWSGVGPRTQTHAWKQ